MIKKIKLFVLFAAVLVCFSIGGVLIRQEKADAEVYWSEITIENSYLSGTSIEIPSRKLVVNGDEYDASAKLIRPDGSATSAKSVVLDDAGKYSVQYYVVVGEVPYTQTVSFVVRERLCAYENEETSVVYGKGVYSGSSEAEGLYVRLKEQDVLEFRQIIDIPTVNEDIPLVQYFIAPDELESADFTKIIFTLTDVKDPSCYLQIVAQSSRPDTGDGRGGCYLLAGGNGQQLKGDQGGNIHVNNNYGARSDKGSFFGYKVAGWTQQDGLVLESVDPSTLAITLKFNPVTCEVKADNTVIIDTDSKAHYGGATDVKWTGFSSGNVRLSVQCEGYNKSSANFVLTDVKDVELAEDDCIDKTPPEITIDAEYDLQNMPYARVGAEEYYPIPSAHAYDLTSGDCAVRVAVYKDYGTESQSRVNVVNGTFNTDTAGVYAIVYTAGDVFGNYSEEKAVYVTARENIPAITFEIRDSEVSYEAGTRITLPAPIVTGGSGEKTVTARAYLEDTEYSFGPSDEVWAFYPEKAGTWTAEYTATDYTGHTAKHSLSLTVTAASVPTFREEAALPQAFVSGLGNRLPELTAYDYTSGTLITRTADVRVTDKNGTKTYRAGEIFVPEVEQNGDAVEITYFYDNGVSSVSRGPFYIPAIFAYEDGNLAVGNYFRQVGGNAFTKTVTDHGVKILSPAGDHAWIFANALVSNGFNLTFGGVRGSGVYERMTITLTDCVNAAQELQIVIARSDAGQFTFSCGSVADDVTTALLNLEDGSVVQNITVGLSRNRLLVNGYAYDPDRFSDGSPFTGFSSGTVNLRFDVTGAKENAVYYVSEVNSYTITRARQDRTAPYISITGNYGGFYTKGDVYTICPAVSADVLAPAVDFTLTVCGPKGNYVTSLDGLTLQGVDPTVAYSIALSEYGVYTVTYSSVENHAPRLNPSEFVYEINVIDDEAPSFRITGKVPVKASKGETVVLPAYTVTDNCSAAENVTSYIVVCNPNGRRIYVTGNAFICDFVGEYEVAYYFVDEAGNTAAYSFRITVE